MKPFKKIFFTFCLASITFYLSAQTQTELAPSTDVEEAPQYIVKVTVEEVNHGESKLIAAPTIQCVEGKPAKFSISSSKYDAKTPEKLIEFEAKINSKTGVE